MSIPLRVVSRIAVSALTLTALLGCSSSTPPAATGSASHAASASAAVTVVAAKDPFWMMYKAAHEWAPDVEAIRVTQKELEGYKNDAGKAGLWEAAFASPSLRQYRLYTYAVADVPPSVFRGVTSGMPMAWGGETRDAMPIDTTLFNIDSDEAFHAASADAAEWLKRNPGKELAALELGQTARFSGPVWYAQWGTRAGGYSALVDATTGKVLTHK